MIKRSDSYHDFERLTFEVAERECFLVQPHTALPGQPWIWKLEYFEAFPHFELAMLAQGFHLGFIKTGTMFGGAAAMQCWEKFYQAMTNEFKMAKRPVLLGLSRGGIYCYDWAGAHPDKVACLYGDNPVCDFRSWPLRRGKSKTPGTFPQAWRAFIEEQGFQSEEAALSSKWNPINNLAALSTERIPIIHVVGEDDDIVPVDENTDIVANRIRAMGGVIKVIRRPGIKHHPHGLEDPTPVIEFVQAAITGS